MALVRPERLLLTPLVMAEGIEGAPATVKQFAFLGDHATVHAILEDGSDIEAFVHAREAERLREGERVVVTVDQTPVLVA